MFEFLKYIVCRLFWVMVRVLRISKLRRNSNISKSKPLPGRGSLSDAVTPSSLKLSYVSLRVRSSFLKNDNRDCYGPINMIQNRHTGELGTHWDKTNKELIPLIMVICFVLFSQCVSATAYLKAEDAWNGNKNLLSKIQLHVTCVPM